MNNDPSPHRGLRHNTHVHPHTGTNWTRPEPFRTPEAVAAEEEQQEDANTAEPIVSHHSKPPKKPLKQRIKDRLESITKKQWIIIGIVAALLIAGGAFALYQFVLKDDPKPVTTVKKTETKKVTTPVPTTVPSMLTGLQVDPSVNERPVTGVMIENSAVARPQSGLADAGVVFEAIAEGGITRFLTLFQDVEPESVGPVRSVRPYYAQWVMGFDAGLAHVGGSAEGVALIRSSGKDLDQFFNTGPYWRVGSRPAPHNMYASVVKLRELQVSKGWTKSNYTGFVRKSKETPSASPTARNIDFNISSAVYNSHYAYDPATNSYLRSVGGQPHIDERVGRQISAKVVVGLVMPQGKNGVYTTYQTIGSGTAFIFQDGVVTQGTWAKASNKSQFTFKDASGTDIGLNPGNTWLTVVGGSNRVTYGP